MSSTNGRYVRYMETETGKELVKKLRSYRRKEYAKSILAVILLFLASAVAATGLSFLAFSAYPYLILAIPLALAAYVYFRRPSFYGMARQVEAEEPGWGDRLSTAVDLSGKNNPKEVYSKELTTRYVSGIEDRLEGAKLPPLDSKKLLTVCSAVLGSTVLFAILIILLIPSRLQFGAAVVFAPSSLDLEITAITEDTLVQLDSYLEVSGKVASPVNLNYLYLERTGSGKYRTKVRIKDGVVRQKVRVTEEEQQATHQEDAQNTGAARHRPARQARHQSRPGHQRP